MWASWLRGTARSHSSAAIQRAVAGAVNVQSFSHTGWIRSQWDLWTAVAAPALALLFGVVDNLTVTPVKPAPTLELWPAAPSGSAPDGEDGTRVNRTVAASASAVRISPPPITPS
jgi:hypothetical protein